MVSREECVTNINNFLREHTFQNAVILWEHLCDIQEIDNKDEAIRKLVSNPNVIAQYLGLVIDVLCNKMELNTITDKYKHLVLVF